MIPNPVYLIQVPARNVFYQYRDDLPLCNKAYLTNSLKSEGMRPSPPTKTQHLPSTSHPCQLHSIKRGNYSPLGTKHWFLCSCGPFFVAVFLYVCAWKQGSQFSLKAMSSPAMLSPKKLSPSSLQWVSVNFKSSPSSHSRPRSFL